MISMFKKINRMLGERLTWNTIEGDDRKFVTSSYSKEDCWIQMNDFPEEPLWTLNYKGESKDIEDTPTLWEINYPNKIEKPLL